MSVSLEQALVLGTGEWRSFTCPVHPDGHPSARVNVRTRKWVCMSCGAKGLHNADVLGYSTELRKRLAVMGEEPRRLSESFLDLLDPSPYWLDRFGPAACQRHGLARDPLSGRDVYPVRQHGELLGLVSRGQRPKYRYPTGFAAQSHLYGFEDYEGDTMVLCEGPSDVFALTQAGVPGAVSVHGAKVSDTHIMLIHRLAPARVLIAFDQDPAGDAGADRALGRLRGLRARRVRWDGANDLGELPVAARQDLFLHY